MFGEKVVFDELAGRLVAAPSEGEEHFPALCYVQVQVAPFLSANYNIAIITAVVSLLET